MGMMCLPYSHGSHLLICKVMQKVSSISMRNKNTKADGYLQSSISGRIFATPKSESLTVPMLVIRMFSGLISIGRDK